MCQMSVIITENGEEKTLMESVTHLKTIEKGISISTLFEEPTLIKDSFVNKIDFMGGKVYLTHKQKE